MPARSPIALALILAACGTASDDGPADDGAGTSGSGASTGAPAESGSADDGATGSADTEPAATTDDGSGTDATSGGVDESSGGSESGEPSCEPSEPAAIYLARDYETENAEELFVEPVATASYLEGECWDRSNCWQVNPIGTAGNEDHAGWDSGMLPPLAEGGTQSMFVGYLLYVSSGMIDAMVNDDVSGKMLDGYQFDLPDGYGPTRQTVIWSYWNPEHPSPDFVDTAASGVVPRLLKGGAGGNYVRQVGQVQFDLQDYPDQWIWIEIELNAAERYTAMWVKTQDGVFSGESCEPIMWRNADDPDAWVHEYYVEEPYAYVANAGWATAGVQWGYWDDLENKPLGEDDFVRVDHLVVSDAWIEPPF